MLSRPNFCCSCGERVERIEWHVWTSRKYCELCQTENIADIWLPRAALAVCLFIGLAGAGSLLAERDRGLDLSEGPVRLAAERSRRLSEGDRTAAGPAGISVPSLPEPVPENDAGLAAPGPEKQAEEPVAFCGALTKKGTPCTRKVKGGGRCWQHKGAPVAEPGGVRSDRSGDERPKADSDPNETS